ncbi:MAG TPA: YggS family pyridoxal phosphate-dependent enzyme [Syntrophales bacterium]|nr:YggS family pyridoxal phosphate-dependent enzyme [Syntrophales bacterium]HOL60084.1 YggS family pyridoxal phosphate-dependent enzyme [Syntrophales bacterium]HPO35360.1 YggS family pyridoxal phosphate-dependent enzyme [Syntrophales bacterium]
MSRRTSIKENVMAIRKRVADAALRAGRTPEEVKLMAVTKTVSPERILEAVDAGVDILGESYVQEAREKISQLGRRLPWHLIGHLQTNKAKYAVRLFEMIHSVDRVEVAQALHDRCRKEGRTMEVLLEVNISGEATKWGVSPTGLIPLIREISRLDTLYVKGLMTMAPWTANPEEARPIFSALRMWRDRIREEGIERVEMRELSMGMSDDFEVAVEEGATIVRIGRAIFGER